jgi:hypothetical protein
MRRFELIDVDKLDADLLDRLFDNAIGGVRIRGFISAELAAALVRAVDARGFDYYKDVDPPIGRIGITQYEHRADEAGRSDYFRLAAAASQRRRRMFASCEDPVELVLDHLAQAWPSSVSLATEDDGSVYFAGLVRMIGSALLHCDWARLDAPGWRIGQVNAQITWNIYCSRADTGGDTLVYDRPWSPDAEDALIEGSYGYRPELVRDAAVVRFAPEPTDLVLFNSRNFHLVEAGSGGSPRITVSSFVGRMPDRSLVLWS